MSYYNETSPMPSSPAAAGSSAPPGARPIEDLLAAAARLLGGRGQWIEAGWLSGCSDPLDDSIPSGERAFVYLDEDGERIGLLLCDDRSGNLYDVKLNPIASIEPHPGPRSRCKQCSAWTRGASRTRESARRVRAAARFFRQTDYWRKKEKYFNG